MQQPGDRRKKEALLGCSFCGLSTPTVQTATGSQMSSQARVASPRSRDNQGLFLEHAHQNLASPEGNL